MQRSPAGSSASQRSPDPGEKFSQPSLPSVDNTAFAPTAGEQAQLSPRPETAQRRSPSFNAPEINSSAMFQDQLDKQHRDIQVRSSPQPASQTPSSWNTQTPTGFDTLFRAFEQNQDRTPSPFATSHPQTHGRSPQAKLVPSDSPFGVIEKVRVVSQNTTQNGQG